MQTFHAAILLLFETCDDLSYEEISKSTQLSDEQLTKHLQGLLEVKILLIVDGVEPLALSDGASTSGDQSAAGAASVAPQYSFTPTTRLRLNHEFTSKRTKFKISVVQRDNQYQQIREQNDSEQTHSSIDEDRKLYIQAAIVRVMKSRKSAKHNHLIQEVIGLTKNHFTPSVPMIKKCIEILIEKQYLERKSSAADEYKYVA
jgi:cullin 2